MGDVNQPTTTRYDAHGKLLLTAEYFVLDGAMALCLPTKRGQSLEITEHPLGDGFFWRSYTNEGICWFEARFDLESLHCEETNDQSTGNTLSLILQAARRQNPEFLQGTNSLLVEAHLEFPRAWGWGSSSTLISMIARWAKADAYQLLKETMGGSGYDLACAVADTPILYQNTPNGPMIKPAIWQPVFGSQIAFVWLNKKQNSRDAIAHYRAAVAADTSILTQISRLTTEFIAAKTAAELEAVIYEHEQLTSQILQLPTVKDTYFADFGGAVKSLGAWGGDFVMAVSSKLSPSEIKTYFANKNYKTMLRLDEI